MKPVVHDANRTTHSIDGVVYEPGPELDAAIAKKRLQNKLKRANRKQRLKEVRRAGVEAYRQRKEEKRAEHKEEKRVEHKEELSKP